MLVGFYATCLIINGGEFLQLVTISPPRFEPITLEFEDVMGVWSQLDRLWYAAHRDRGGIPIILLETPEVQE